MPHEGINDMFNMFSPKVNMNDPTSFNPMQALTVTGVYNNCSLHTFSSPVELYSRSYLHLRLVRKDTEVTMF